MARDRGAAGAVEYRQKGTLGDERCEGLGVSDAGDERARLRIVVTRLDRHDALTDRGEEFLDRKYAACRLSEAETLEARERKQRGVDRALFKLAQAGSAPSPDRNNLEIGAQVLHDRLPAERSRADHGAGRQLTQELRR